MTWLNELVQQHSELESPTAFWYWSGLCAISAVVKDNIWLDCGGAYNLYPNIYVMLHADSGLKKGPPVSLAKDLVRRVNNTKIISGRSSIQGILRELGTASTSPGGKVSGKSVCFIVASEFSSSLVSDPAAMTILTDLYDRHYNEGEYRSLLKMESFQLKDPTISLLVATNEAHFEDFITAKDVHGGFIGRMFVIAEREVHRLNPLIRKMKIVPDREKLALYLKELSLKTGPFDSMEDMPAGNLYEEWYYGFHKTVREEKIKDDTGTIQRFGDSVKKVAMLLSLAESPDLIITEDNIKEAIEVCETFIGSVRRTTMGKKTVSTYANQKTLIIKELLEQEDHRITRTELLHKYHLHFNGDELTNIMQTFDEAKMIVTKSENNIIIYEMPKEQARDLIEYLEGKSK